MNGWPKREDGTNKTMGEMTRDERRAQFKASIVRIKVEMEAGYSKPWLGSISMEAEE